MILTATRTTPTDVVHEAVTVALKICSISPNPFNTTTTISFDVYRPGNVQIKIFNRNGQLVETLRDSYFTAGSHTLTWNAAQYSSGVYHVLVSSRGQTDMRKVTFMK